MVHTTQHIDPSRLFISRFRIISIPPAKDDLMGETTFQAVKAGSAMVNPWEPLKQNHPRLTRNGCYGGNSSHSNFDQPFLLFTMGFTIITIYKSYYSPEMEGMGFPWLPGHLPFWGTRAADRSRPGEEVGKPMVWGRP